ncbi:uncharacterized protein CANTADRAFT_8469 [Suhomyces tanzawaensis NRRL Y-17324]|uniref:Altered inheritance of mitochondria protein 23, mitochondrial n=1 Tax=Suhomyces tanzawaensis NRRL Y-17324 TaxID=984487 RepID=A0A1E4SBI0_9ASCO|nr:uncharacterized protein CANTADRAFT_8469 [Suhomyces tanzawaensis NRRL Y-17324]ODV76890.1 hypothetical protein CANTADRAFT_8469 [Suhomyces tanzawaensis NRRL Y-17324]
MLRVIATRNCAARQLHSSCLLRKPLDFATSETTRSKSKPFSLDNVFIDKAATNGDKSNRFATMFRNDDKPRPKNNAGPRGGSYSGNRFNKADAKKHDVERKPHRRIVRFEFNTGTLQSQTALKALISKVHEQNSHYKVKYVDPESSRVVSKFLVDITNNLDLKQHGLSLIVKEGDLPMLKRVKVEEMVKNYSQQLALEKENELLQKGSIVAQKVVKQRLRAEKKKSAAKTLTLFWKISIGDLRNQKKLEIERKLSKGEKFTLYLKSKLHFVEEVEDGEVEETAPHRSENILHSNKFKDEQELNIELKRRQMIYEGLVSILDDLPCTYKVEGKSETRYIISIAPKETESPKAVEAKDSDKELKKQKKLMKQREREQKSKPKTKVEDLDSLYSFKLDD